MMQDLHKKLKKSEYDFITPVIALLVIITIGYGAQYWYDNVRTPSSYSVCLQGFNYTDRIIDEFYVNGLGGGNIAAKEGKYPYGGGGGFSCDATVEGNKLKIKWEYAMNSVEDYRNHVKPETHEVTLPMPKAQSNHSRYFQVRIFPDHHVELALKDGIDPYRNKEEENYIDSLILEEEKEKMRLINEEEARKAAEKKREEADAIAAQKKFDEENEAAYQRYKAEHDKKQQGSK